MRTRTVWGLAVGKLVISVKNTGKRLFAEIYGTSHGWDATRFKIDIERGILQVHEGCSGFSHRSGEQAWLKTDVRPGPEYACGVYGYREPTFSRIRMCEWV